MSAPAPTDFAPAPMPIPPTDFAPAPMPAPPIGNCPLWLQRKKRGSGVETRRWEKLEEGLARCENGSYYNHRSSYSPAMPGLNKSYIEMKKRLKIWIYREGEPPIFHDGSSLYSIEGHFIKEMDKQRLPFITTSDPEQALLYFLPFSVQRMRRFVASKASVVDLHRMWAVICDYIEVIANKYMYWNNTNVDINMNWAPSGHVGAPYVTVKQELIKSLIRVMCSANISEGFNPRKDAPLSEFYFRFCLRRTATPPSSKRVSAFFAGRNHGSVRKILFKQWDDKDPQIQIFQCLSRGQSYKKHMMNAKYCLCPSGYEVASPRLTESILAVPIPVQKIPELKEILTNIAEHLYLKLLANVMKVEKHFVINEPSKRFDVIHMLFHSIWLRRHNVRLYD
ncbi:putative glycosyltransferase [Nymphaea thermarum]|nr:putative glycosyltransferase [Nymphaea thermarum]